MDDIDRAASTQQRPSRQTWALRLAAGLVVVVVAAGLAQALGGGGSGSNGATSSGSSTTQSAPGTPGGVAGDANKGAVLPQPAPAVGGTGSEASDGTTKAPSGLGRASGDSARIVKTGEISLLAAKGKVSAVLEAVQGIATGAGGYVATSSSQESGSSPSGSVTLRVPVARYESVLQRVRDLGQKVISGTSSGTDVTATYADTQAQIRSLTAVRSRFLVILAKATTIGDILSVQQRVDDVQGQIDRLEASRRVLADSSDLATLTVSVQQTAGSLTEPPKSGWAKAWHDAVSGFTTGLEAILARSGRTLVVLLCLGLLFLLGRFGWRVARRADR